MSREILAFSTNFFDLRSKFLDMAPRLCNKSGRLLQEILFVWDWSAEPAHAGRIPKHSQEWLRYRSS